MDWLPWLSGATGLALLVVLWARYRRDAPLELRDAEDEPAPIAEAPEPDAVPAAGPVYRTSGPWLTVALRPTRAGLNMVTAVADCDVTVTNEGAGSAENIRAALTLLGAHSDQQAAIAAVNSAPIARSVVPPFTLRPGESRTFRAVASAHLPTLPTMRAGGRDMLVPLVLLQVQHRDGGGAEHRTSQSFVIGVERVDSPKLAPFWLDSLRMVDQVAARASGAPERRRLPAHG